MIKTRKIKIKLKQTKISNTLHFDVQRKTKASIVNNGKGKGSYRRIKVKSDET